MRILVVEDDAEIGRLLTRLLERNNYIVDLLGSTKLALESLDLNNYAAVILDRGLPDGDGLDVIDGLRAARSAEDIPPFIVLSALGEPAQRIDGLEAGAVDYIVKPYEPNELLLRLDICINHKVSAEGKAYQQGNVTYWPSTQQIHIDGTLLVLRRRELLIFDRLMRSFGSIVSYETLADAAYGIDDEIESNALASHVSRLRKLLADAGATITVKVMRHVGYFLQLAE